jgi:TetR/AcrR family transcriptional regulator
MTRNATPRTARRAGRRPRRSHDSRATRKSLLSAAAKLFAARGFDGASVAEIAQQAGANKALINYHFGGKLQLYRTILREMFVELLERVEPLRADPRPPDQVLREFIAIVGDTANRRRAHLSKMMLREVIAGGPHLDHEVLIYPMRVFAVVREIIERGVRERVFRPVDPIMTHLSLVGSLVFFFASARFRERVLAARLPRIEPPTPAAYVKHVQDLIAHGLAAERRAARGRA